MAAKQIELGLEESTVERLDKIIREEIETITEDTISLENLGSDLLESDIDKYLALKEEAPSKLTKSAKYKLVAELLAEQASKKGRRAAIDKHFFNMAIEARVIAERTAKETELHTALRQATSEYKSKFDLKNMRSEIKDLEGYKDKATKEELKACRKEIKERKAEKTKRNLELKAQKFVTDVAPKLEDTAYYAEILVSLKPLLDNASEVIKLAELAKQAEHARLTKEVKEREEQKQEEAQPQSDTSI